MAMWPFILTLSDEIRGGPKKYGASVFGCLATIVWCDSMRAKRLISAFLFGGRWNGLVVEDAAWARQKLWWWVNCLWQRRKEN